MILSAESWGIEMRRFCILFLLLPLLLVGCSSRFTTAEGGYLDGKTDKVYQPLSEAFKAISYGEEVGVWESKVYEDSMTFYEIPGADKGRFLTDDKGNVYCADKTVPDAAGWSVQTIYVCDESAISMAVGEITSAEVISQIRTLWHEGAQAELPIDDIAASRRLKMVSDDCPGIYYCVLYYLYEDGSAYFYDRFERRAVLVGKDLVNKIPIT